MHDRRLIERLCRGITIMLVTAILHLVMRVVNATAYANQLRAERMLNAHLARAGNTID
jgi:hypothetical protein